MALVPIRMAGGPRWLALALVALLMSSGCFGTSAPSTGAETDGPALDRSKWIPEEVVWDTSGLYSRPLGERVYEAFPPELIEVGSHDGTRIAVAMWRPDVPDGQQVPVILDAGPYWSPPMTELPADDRDKQVFVEEFVPRGYAYGHVAVRGTAASGGCMEFFSENAQKDLDAVVTYFGTQAWSNGNVALMGKSYDGTTAWMAATFGNPHLKTIVPESGLTSVYDHSFRNGTVWTPGLVFHGFYWAPRAITRTVGGHGDGPTAELCREALEGVVANLETGITGDRETTGPWSDYWQVRDFRQSVLENYRGSVFLVHGLQDWRVPPHMAFPFINELAARGNDVKILLGQWDHDHPDDPGLGEHKRWDYAEMLLRWFDRYLYENKTVDTGPRVHVEDLRSNWRTEDAWPPADVNWTTYHLGEDRLSAEPTAPGQRALYGPWGVAASNVWPPVLLADIGTTNVTRSALEHWAATGPLRKELRFAGSAQLHVTVTPTSPEGGRVYAEIVDVGPWWHFEPVAHAVLDLRYYDGGYERHTLTPGEPVVAKMEFFPADVVIPAGHQLAIRIVAGNGYSEHRASHGWGYPSHLVDVNADQPVPPPIVLSWGGGGSVAKLPVLVRDVDDGTYAGQP